MPDVASSWQENARINKKMLNKSTGEVHDCTIILLGLELPYRRVIVWETVPGEESPMCHHYAKLSEFAAEWEFADEDEELEV